jgi:Co/Zn/Cd efflux system component
MLSCFVFLASLCFSLVVEALQTLAHIEHKDEMHHPIPVMFVGACGLLLNGLCYLLIGGKYALVMDHSLGYSHTQAEARKYIILNRASMHRYHMEIGKSRDRRDDNTLQKKKTQESS